MSERMMGRKQFDTKQVFLKTAANSKTRATTV